LRSISFNFLHCIHPVQGGKRDSNTNCRDSKRIALLKFKQGLIDPVGFKLSIFFNLGIYLIKIENLYLSRQIHLMGGIFLFVVHGFQYTQGSIVIGSLLRETFN